MPRGPSKLAVSLVSCLFQQVLNTSALDSWHAPSRGQEGNVIEYRGAMECLVTRVGEIRHFHATGEMQGVALSGVSGVDMGSCHWSKAPRDTGRARMIWVVCKWTCMIHDMTCALDLVIRNME